MSKLDKSAKKDASKQVKKSAKKQSLTTEEPVRAIVPLKGGTWRAQNIQPALEIDQGDTVLYGAGMTSAAILLGQGQKKARARQIIYEKWMRMEANPIVSSALLLLCTAALGGHETSGQLVFVEESGRCESDKLKTLVKEISDSLTPLFNKIAFQMAYIGAVYGDAYARIYSVPKEGVIELSCDELVRPQLVQPFERGGRTVGYAIYTGERNFERLNVLQLGRLKMPRTQWIPQFGVVERSMKQSLEQDDVEKLPLMPSLVGGSLLYNAEEAYEMLNKSLLGLVGQRWLDSIDEQILTVNVESMTTDQQKIFIDSFKRMLRTSKEIAEKSVKENSPVLQRVRHILPIHNEKQMMQLAGALQSGRTASITIDDVMLHARLLAGALGVDLSMIGFADQLAGGLGEGGFFRTSAQAAERARVIRVALAEFFDSIIDIHTLQKYDFVFPKNERPWKINFYGSISALEAEKQRTRSDAMNAGGILAQTMQVLKELGADKTIMREFLAKTLMLDEEQAELYSKIVEMKQPEGAEEHNPFGG